MVCCSHCHGFEIQFGRKRAERDLAQYKRGGADAVTKLMLAELQKRLPPRCNLLDIGAGIGVINAELARCGVGRVTVVEASPSYLDVARQEVGLRYAQGSAEFVLGDFSLIGAGLTDADVVTLGRVVCCYPDAGSLLQAAARRTRRLLASSYPPNRWDVRIIAVRQNFWRRLRGSEFRTYVHAPNEMDATLEPAGLRRVARKTSSIWVLDVYERFRPAEQAPDNE